jgi:hypothetical protein
MDRFSVGRGRTTWTVDRLSNSCRVDTLKDHLGVAAYDSIGQAAKQLPPIGRDELDASFRAEGLR